MGRNQEPLGSHFKEYLKEVAAVEPQNRPAVRGQVADPRQGGIDPIGRSKIRHVEKIMNLSHPSATLVDAAYLGGEEESY